MDVKIININKMSEFICKAEKHTDRTHTRTHTHLLQKACVIKDAKLTKHSNENNEQ